jgi:multidrug efflux pump subunit AcrA (membrane-fusion protein)
MKFDTGSRKSSGNMSGRIVNTAGVTLAGGEEGGRRDWIQIDVVKAANAYRDGLVPEEEKKRVNKAQLDAARLTLERREMREEMARLRRELKAIKSGGRTVPQAPEERLKTLLDLKAKKLITDEEYQKRRAQILGEL